MGLFSSHHSDSYYAQVIANETNREIAEKNNQWNWANLQAQNVWNLEQWNRENAYNSPKQQVERLMEAGINPLWAMSDADSGNAAHLESGSPLPASSWEARPEYDVTQGQRIANIIAASRDLMNAGLSFKSLELQGEDVQTRRAAQISLDDLNRASAANKRAATTSQEIQNQWVLSTFDVRAKQETQKLSNMRKQLDLMDAQSENYRSLKANYDASTELTREKISRIAEDYKLAWKEIAIKQQSADAQLIGAQAQQASAAAQQTQAETAQNRLKFDIHAFDQTVIKWSNEQLLDFMKNFGRTVSGEMKAGVEVSGLGVSGKAGIKQTTPADVAKMYSCGIQALERYSEHPEDESLSEAASIAVQNTEKLISGSSAASQRHRPDIEIYSPYNTYNQTSVVNPSAPWQQ